ncbi:Adgf-B [Drosophila busckii]|uniref:Adenosine deaminase n=1 Tax=Drosophila busckii TaxID=30019 RepID=A0A0M4EVR1_DROBS|nr:adenosine deaminase 2 [Drosophila busckii]ALC41757.1 Adgf-B [Drosophila busckii]
MQWHKTLTPLGRQYSGSSLAGRLVGLTNLRRATPAAYRKVRDIVCTYERAGGIGSDLQLTANEKQANDVIMALKLAEYQRGIMDPTQFAPGYHIFQMLYKIKQSPLFKVISSMPKGGALKTHDTSMCSSEFLIKLTHKPHLWVCTREDGRQYEIVQFRYAREQPSSNHQDCSWLRMEELRESRGDRNVHEYLRARFSMYPLSRPQSNADAWSNMMSIFRLVDGLVKYEPNWGEYYYNALKEFHADEVQYVEVRSLLPRLYSLDGQKLQVSDTVKVYNEQLQRFKQQHPDFIDSKLIYAPLRHIDAAKLATHVKLCTELNAAYPELLIGFDLVGQEDLGYPLSAFAMELLKLPQHINFYFHAGQTNWYGSPVDENLVDAVLLGTRRIAHGYALCKHPLIMQLVKQLGIAIEVCPVGNQVLQLGTDYRNHPAASFIANNIPFVISSGNPSFWRTTPLSHDFYLTFLGIAPMNADLTFLKRLAKNSIKYSALKDEDKAKANEKWKLKWDKWIDDVIAQRDELFVAEAKRKAEVQK